MKPLRRLSPWIVAMGMPLAAQAVSFGLTAGGVVPVNDLRTFNRNPGGTAGGFMDLDLGGGTVFRPRIDAVWIAPETEAEGGADFRRKVWAFGLTVDYLYHFSGARRGLFALAGVGIYHLEARIQGAALDRKDRTNQLGGSMGLGYTFNAHWDMNLHYTYTSFNSSLPSQQGLANPTAAMVILACAYRF